MNDTDVRSDDMAHKNLPDRLVIIWWGDRISLYKTILSLLISKELSSRAIRSTRNVPSPRPMYMKGS